MGISTKKYFLTFIILVRSFIIDNLSIVSITCTGKSSLYNRIQWILYIDKLRSSSINISSNNISISRFFINHNIMSMSKTIVVSVFCKNNRHTIYINISKPFQVKNLHAVICSLTHYKCIILIYFNVSPNTFNCMTIQFSNINRVNRIRNINKSSINRITIKCIFFTGQRVCPPPTIISIRCFKYTVWQKR